MKPTSFVTLIVAGIGLVSLGRAAAPVVFAQSAPSTKGDVIYVPTPPAVVDAMLQVASGHGKGRRVRPGSGDGRIVITAAKKYGARGVGIEIDPALVKKATKTRRRRASRIACDSCRRISSPPTSARRPS